MRKNEHPTGGNWAKGPNNKLDKYQSENEKEEISSYKKRFKRVKKRDWGLI